MIFFIGQNEAFIGQLHFFNIKKIPDNKNYQGFFSKTLTLF